MYQPNASSTCEHSRFAMCNSVRGGDQLGLIGLFLRGVRFFLVSAAGRRRRPAWPPRRFGHPTANRRRWPSTFPASGCVLRRSPPGAARSDRWTRFSLGLVVAAHQAGFVAHQGAGLRFRLLPQVPIDRAPGQRSGGVVDGAGQHHRGGGGHRPGLLALHQAVAQNLPRQQVRADAALAQPLHAKP